MLSKFKRILPRLTNLANQAKSPFATAGGKDLSARNVKTGVARRERLQFSKDRLTEFGELPIGEIPEALRYDRPVGMCLSLFNSNPFFRGIPTKQRCQSC